MKLSQQKSLSLSLISKLALPALALISITAGIVAGSIFRTNHKDSSAASANITVRDNDQTIEQDQSTGEIIITRTSIVTVKNPEANYGYTLSAKLTTTIPNSTVTIASPTSTDCPTDTPCLLNTSTPITILTTTDNTATEANGDTTTFTVAITIPAGTLVSDYVLDIEYSEEANDLSTLIEGANMQDITKDICDATPTGTMVNLKDTRDGTYYRVKKMIDGNCWMVDNLAYNINSAPAEGKPAYNPAPLLGGSNTNARAQYVENNNIAGQGQIPNNGNPKASHLYNWCAALGDTSTNCTASANASTLQTVINGTATTTATATNQPEVQGICPAPFRLPKGGPVANPANNGTNTATALASTANEFVKLDIAMGGTGTGGTSASTYPFWIGSDADSRHWHGVIHGGYYNGFINVGSLGSWRTSTAASGTMAYKAQLGASNGYVYPSTTNSSTPDKPYSVAVRCLL